MQVIIIRGRNYRPEFGWASISHFLSPNNRLVRSLVVRLSKISICWHCKVQTSHMKCNMTQQNKFPESAYSVFFTSWLIHWVIMIHPGPFALTQHALSFTSVIQPSRESTRVGFKETALGQEAPYHGSSLFCWTLLQGRTRPQMAHWSQRREERSLLQWKCGNVRKQGCSLR